MTDEEKEELLSFSEMRPGTSKICFLAHYGKLPVGWPPDWVYQSAFGDEWEAKIKGAEGTISS